MIFFYIKDCFWLLSTFLEYANHNILYSAFKDTNSMSLNQDIVVMPKRLAESDFGNFSRVLKSRGECSNERWLPAIVEPVENVFNRNEPSKE